MMIVLRMFMGFDILDREANSLLRVKKFNLDGPILN